MSDWTHFYLHYVRFNLVWVFFLGVVCIVWATRKGWREHWINTGDDRFLGLNTDSFRLVAPLLIWLVTFGIVGMLLDMMAGTA